MGKKIDVDVDDILMLLRSTSSGLDALKTLIDALPTDADIGNLPWDELQAAHVVAGSFGKQIKDIKDKVDTLSAGGDATLAKQNEILTEINANETKIDAIEAKLDVPDNFKADVSALATAAALAVVDNEIAAIEAKLDVPGNFKADVSALATAAALAVVDNEIAAIEAKLDVPGNFKADVSGLSTSAALTTHDTEIKAEIAKIVNKDATPHVQTIPKLQTAVSVTTGVAAWVEGSWAEIIPVNIVSETFWIVGVWWRSMHYQAILEIGTGTSGSEVEIASLPGMIYLATNAGFMSARPTYLSVKIKVPANTRISARVADAHTASNTHIVKVIYATGL